MKLLCVCRCHNWYEGTAAACRHAERYARAFGFKQLSYEFVGVSLVSEPEAFLACTLCQRYHCAALLPKVVRREVTPWVDAPRPVRRARDDDGEDGG